MRFRGFDDGVEVLGCLGRGGLKTTKAGRKPPQTGLKVAGHLERERRQKMEFVSKLCLFDLSKWFS